MNLDDMLRQAGEQDAPPPDPSFVRRLESRLAGGVVTPLARRRRFVVPAAAAGVAAAAVLAVLVGVHRDDEPSRVVTEPKPSVTTSTLAPETTTSTTNESTTSTSVAPVVTTVPKPRPTPTTTTVLPTTTSTAAPAPQDLHLSCVPQASGPSIHCSWFPPQDPRFDYFLLTRHTGDGPIVVVYRGKDLAYADPSRVGAHLYYDVTEYASDGTVLGSGHAEVTCC